MHNRYYSLRKILWFNLDLYLFYQRYNFNSFQKAKAQLNLLFSIKFLQLIKSINFRNYMTTFSKENLLQILSSTEKYKEIQPYLNAIRQENQQIYAIIDEVILSVMQSHTISPIVKLQTLRLFKDIFMTSQFNCIQSLDQNIQEHIFKVAAYNSKLKKGEKGNNYFIEVQKRQNTKQVKQLGLCYVIFAQELVKNMAILFPKDFDNQQSRYVTKYQQLLKSGIAFSNKNQYFFASDAEKFKKNFNNWVLKETQKQKKKKSIQESNMIKAQQKVDRVQPVAAENQKKPENAQSNIEKKEKTIAKIQQSDVKNNKTKQQQIKKRQILTKEKAQQVQQNQIKEEVLQQFECIKTEFKSEEVKQNQIKEQTEETSAILQSKHKKKLQLSVSQCNQKKQPLKEIAQNIINKNLNEKSSNQENVSPQKQTLKQKNMHKGQKILNNVQKSKLNDNQTIQNMAKAINKSKVQQQIGFCLQKSNLQKRSYEQMLKQLKTLREQTTKYRAIQAEKAKQFQNIVRQNEEIKKIISQQTKQLQENRRIIEQLQKKSRETSKELQNQKIALKEKQQTIQQLSEVINIQNSQSQMIKNLQAKIAASFQQLAKKQKQNQQTRDLLAQLQKQYEKQLQKVEKKLAQTKKENLQLKQQITKIITQNAENIYKNIDQQQNKIDIIVQQESSLLLKAQNQFKKSGFILDRSIQKRRSTHKQLLSSQFSMSNFLAQTRKKQQHQKQQQYCKPNDLFMKTQTVYQTKNNFYSMTSNSLSKTQNSFKKFAVNSKGFQTGTGFYFQNKRNNLQNMGINSQGKPIPRKSNCQQLQEQDQNTKQLISIIPFIEDYFAPLKCQQSIDFKAMCLKKNLNSPIFANEYIEVRLMHISTQKMMLSIRNKYSQQLIIDIKSINENFVIENNHKRALQPGSYIDFSIKATPIDLNLRFPVFLLCINRINEKLKYSIPIPITLLNYCQFFETNKCYTNEFTKKYKTQRFSLNKKYRNISSCLTELEFYRNANRTIWVGQVKHKLLRSSEFLIRIISQNRVCWIQVECIQQSIAQKFAKVLLQILLFLLK